FLSIPKKELISKIENTQKQLELYTDERVDFINNNHEKMKELVASAKIKLTVLQKKIDEIDTLKDQKDFSVCGPSMKEIDLENEYIYKRASKKGPFYGLSRDNQDGVGTCFANTDKNLLVGLSDGKMAASFIDISLKYKQENGTYITQGIEAGGACASLL